MNRVNLLCAMSRFMMEAFSQRTVEGLKSYTLFRLALPPFRSFLDINVNKEVTKDRIVILEAARLQQSGISPNPSHISSLLQEARKIDQSFIRKAGAFPIQIQIHYQDIEHYRQRRIELLLQTSYRILSEWQDIRSFRVAVSKLYNEAELRQLLNDILRLYAMETRMLSRSIHIPSLFALGRDSITQTINNVMQQEATTLSRKLAHRLYRPGN